MFQFQKYTAELMKCEEVILLNAKTCLQQSELYPAQLLHKQFVELYLEQNDYLSGKFFLVSGTVQFFSQILIHLRSKWFLDGVFGVDLCGVVW